MTKADAWPRVPMVVINAGTDAADGADLTAAIGMRMTCGAYKLPDRAITEGQVVSALVTASENVDSAIHDTKHAFAIYLRRVEA